MDVREKLVELLQDENNPVWKWFQNNMAMAQLADYLISNGVTVQEWIPVDERLPEETGRYLTANKILDDKIDVFDLWFDGGFWYIDDEDEMFDYEVTHWMPLPQPPKGGLTNDD